MITQMKEAALAHKKRCAGDIAMEWGPIPRLWESQGSTPTQTREKHPAVENMFSIPVEGEGIGMF